MDVCLRTNDVVRTVTIYFPDQRGEGRVAKTSRTMLLFFLPDMVSVGWFALFVHVESGRMRHTFGSGFL
jgi:hypothetical protein